MAIKNGTSQNDSITGTSSNDFIYGFEGDDTLSGGAGVDEIYGGLGNDTIKGDNGDDRLFGDEGNDTLSGGSGNDVINGGAGDDIIWGDGGKDTIVMNRNGGTDTINAFQVLGQTSSPSSTVVNNLDTVKFDGQGLTAANMILTQIGADVQVSFEGIDDVKVVLKGVTLANLDNEVTTSAGLIGNFIFNGESVVTDSFDTTLTSSSTPKDSVTGYRLTTITKSNIATFLDNVNNRIEGSSSNDVINAQGGDDIVLGNAGNDILRGEIGQDTLIGGNGADILVGGAGNDKLIGGNASILSSTNITATSDDSLADVALYSGNASEYTLAAQADGSVIVTDNVAGRDGVDRLYNMDIIRFKNADVNVQSLFNVAPVAVDDNLVTAEDVPLRITTAQLLANDSDGNNDALVIQSINNVVGGSVSWDNGDLIFTPTLNSNGQASFSYTISDGRGGVAQATAHINVTPVNDAPVWNVANAIQDQVVNEDQAFNLVVPANTFSDVDQDALSFSAVLANGSALPSWLNFDSATRTFSGMPQNQDVGAIQVKVIAKDAGQLSAEQVFNITVNNVNDAPTAQALSSQQAIEGQLWNFVVPAGTFADVDAGDHLVYSAMLANGGALPSWLSFDSASLTFSGIPDDPYAPSIEVKVIATDSQNASVSSNFWLNVTPVNDAPNAPVDLNSVNNQVVETLAVNGSAVGITVQASDVDSNNLVYSLSDNAGGRFAIDANTGVITVANASLLDFSGATSAYSIKAIASDGTANSIESSFNISVVLLPKLFSQGADTVNFNNISLGQYAPTSFYDALAGNDNIILPTLAKAAELGFSYSQTFFAGAGDDTITMDMNATLYKLDAGDGNDTVYGSSRGDLIEGGTGADFIFGNDGNDVLNGGLGNDVINGGNGFDTLLFDTGAQGVIVNLSTNTVMIPNRGEIDNIFNIEIVTGTSFGDSITGNNALENSLRGMGGADVIYGGDGMDFIYGGDGDDIYLAGEQGNDQILGENGNDTIFGGTVGYLAIDTGNDSLYGGAGDDYIYGGDGNDTIVGGDGIDDLNGEADNDLIYGNLGNDTLRGGTGDDNLNGDDGNDYLLGEDGNDNLMGGNGVDNLNGGNGNDLLNGGAEGDSINGAAGDDIMIGGAGDDWISGGLGFDTLSVADAKASVNFNFLDWMLTGSTNADVGTDYFGPDIEKYIGSQYNDLFDHLQVANLVLEGHGGHDTYKFNIGTLQGATNVTITDFVTSQSALENNNQENDLLQFKLPTGQTSGSVQVTAAGADTVLNVMVNNAVSFSVTLQGVDSSKFGAADYAFI